MRQSVHIRLPLSLLDHLKARAEAESVSLNTYVVAILAGAAGYPVEERKDVRK
jgi:hypothetical protein